MTTLIPKFQQSGTGASNRPINLKLAEVISIADFGAVANADNSVAIQNAINSASGTGTIILLNVASLISTPILVNKDNIIFQGNFSSLSFQNPFIPLVDPSNTQGDIEIPTSMFKVFSDNVTFENILFDNTDFCQYIGSYVGGSTCIEVLKSTSNCLVNNIKVINDPYSGGASVLFRETGTNHTCKNSTFISYSTTANSGNCGCSGWGDGVIIDGCYAENLLDEHLSITAGGRSKIVNNTVINTRTTAGAVTAVGAGIAVANAAYDFIVANNTIYCTSNAGILLYNATVNVGDANGVISNNLILSQSAAVAGSQSTVGISATSTFNKLVINGNYINIVGNAAGLNAYGIAVYANGLNLYDNVIIKRSGNLTAGISLFPAVAGALPCRISNNTILDDGTGTVGILLAEDYNSNEVYINDNYINGCTNGIGSAYTGVLSNLTPYLNNNIFVAVTTNLVAMPNKQPTTNNGNGLLLVNTQTGSTHCITRDVATNAGNIVLEIGKDSGAVSPTAYFQSVGTTSWNVANTALQIGRDTTTSRSINAGGTVNASGADYAEYMTKANDFVLAKGDVVGIDANGKLTNIFVNAISFMVKSTDPSYVGGDSWGNEEALGLTNPKQPVREKDDTDEAFADKEAQYTADKVMFDEALEAARQLVDRIAFAGQVPVNVLGATAGQYIIPVNDNGAIKGEAVSSPTFEQYQTAVGKVIAIEADGRAKIIVKVA